VRPSSTSQRVSAIRLAPRRLAVLLSKPPTVARRIRETNLGSRCFVDANGAFSPRRSDAAINPFPRRNPPRAADKGSTHTLVMRAPSLRLTLRELRSEEILPLWCFIDSLEEAGRISGTGARRWKSAIYDVMTERGLSPEDLGDMEARPLAAVAW